MNKRGIFLGVLMLMIISACEKDEEIIPVVPADEESVPPVAKPEISEGGKDEQVKSSLNFDSELFQFGKFKKMPYRVLVPRNYDSTKVYPLHLFLHGLGERGIDNEQQLSVGSSHFLADSIRNNYPSFIIYPQCPATEYWFSDSVTQTLKDLIDEFVTNQRIDKEKISLGGFSMGAYGTFDMVARYPGFFEAAVAISGDGDEKKASDMAKTRWQIFAGQKDDVVASSKTEEMAKALEKVFASVSFTLYPYADHGHTWQKAFSEPDFFYLLFSED